MADSSEKKEQSDGEDRVGDEPKEGTSSTSIQTSSLSSNEENLSPSLESGNKDQQEENKIDGEPMDEPLKVQPTILSSAENKSSNLTENGTKRSKSKDQVDDKKIISHNCGSDSEEDSSKRQKLNDSQPNTSTNGNSQENSSSGKFDVTHFPKLEPKFKKRNYRSQSNSSEIADDSNEQIRAVESTHEESNSSESIEFQEESREGFVDSSDERSEVPEEHGDSNDWTTASDDDIDEIPAVLQKEPSKTDWSIIKDVANRQIGFNNTINCRFYSSLHAVQRLELMYKLEEHLGCVNALDFNKKGNLLASASDDLTVTVWDWAIGKKHIALQTGHRSNVFQSKWLPLDTESFIVTCARDGQVRLLDIRSSVTRKLAHHRAACLKIATHLDLPHMVLSAGEDSKVLSIDVRENKPTKLLSVKENDQEVELQSIDSNPLNNVEFCVAGRTRFVKIYDRRKTSAPLHQLCPKNLLSDEFAHISCAVYNYNGTEIIASYNNEDIYLFDTAVSYQSGDFAHRYQGHRNSATVKGVNFFGPNSEFILSGSDCGNIFIWDKKTEAIVQWMPGDEQGVVNALEPHPHIPILATSGLDYDVKIWVPSREETPNIKQQLQSCVKKNLTARAKTVRETESVFDGHVLWIMLRHIRQAERRRHFLARRSNRNLNNVYDDESDVDHDDDDEDDDDVNLIGENDNSNSSSSNDNSSENDLSES